MDKMLDPKWRRLQVLATSFRETGEPQLAQSLYEEINPYIFEAVRKSRYGVVDGETADYCSEVRYDVFRLLKSPSWDPRRQPFPTMLARVTNNSLHDLWVYQRHDKRRVNYEAVSLGSLNLNEMSYNMPEAQTMNRCVLNNIHKFSSRASRMVLEAAVEHRTFNEIGEAVGMTRQSVIKRLRQMGKDASRIESLAYDPWPVIFQAVVLEGQTTLHYPTRPFYAAIPLQKKVSTQWGLSIGRQRLLKDKRKLNTIRVIPVRLLDGRSQ